MVRPSRNEPAGPRGRGAGEETGGRYPRWLAPAGLFALTLLAYANSLGLDLAEDSQFLLTQNPRLQSLTAQNLWLILYKSYWWPVTADLIYRPITTASLLFNHALAGAAGGAFWYHLVNLLLHALNVWLVWKLAARLLSSRAAWFAAALFAVHPIATEAVDNVVGRAWQSTRPAPGPVPRCAPTRPQSRRRDRLWPAPMQDPESQFRKGTGWHACHKLRRALPCRLVPPAPARTACMRAGRKPASGFARNLASATRLLFEWHRPSLPRRRPAPAPGPPPRMPS